MKTLILGASRGLGLALKTQYQDRGHEVLGFSRTLAPGMDFTKSDNWEKVTEVLGAQRAARIIYCAGGGPHGLFANKNFSDHQWAFRLNFEFPAFLLHQILRKSDVWSGLGQICFVGSAVAESADPMASSYAAAKQALRGLIHSVHKEDHGALDIRLFSPGYMDTMLLPANAWPRQRAGLVKSPEETARALILWLENDQSANTHQVFE